MSNWNIICISVKIKSWRMVIHSKPHNLTVLLLYPVIVTCYLFTHEAPNSFKCARAFHVEREFESVGFWEEEKTGEPKKILLEQEREPKTNRTLIWCWCWDLSPGYMVRVEYYTINDQIKPIMPLFYLHTAQLVIFFLREGRGCLCEKEKDFKAFFLGKQPSHFALPEPLLAGFS